ncbi:hypothetical protein L2E82_27542 [Cichorium intybus]|uniref:Uncharacterized protein n=1 Tax=Cichorium intybus TaxID=13427 RepID=A0ACB9CTN1_CICIN|nr:hypothetical protein L2E82_27542 [Cichorium intybus]
MSDDNWVTAAMDDTDLVVQVLFTLRQAALNRKPPPLGWSIRQRRSRPQVVVAPAAAKKSPAARASPTTPLSWSGATSISGGGIEESSKPIQNRSDILRSKVARPNETTPTKKPRKKKTLAELKEDETLLLKERKQLKRQLATLQATFEKQRNENESLKKMKMDMQLQQQGDEFVLPDLNIPAGEDE